MKIPAQLHTTRLRDNCNKSAYLPLDGQPGGLTTRYKSFYDVFSISWQDCGGEDDFLVDIDGKSLHLPQLLPIARGPILTEVFAFSTIDFETKQPILKAEDKFEQINKYAWEVKKYSLLNVTVNKNGKKMQGFLIGFSRNPNLNYAVEDEHVYGLTENSAASQTITNILKILPGYWLWNFVLSLFDEDAETIIKGVLDWVGDFFKNSYFFLTRGILLFLSMYYLTRQIFGDGYVGIGTALGAATFIRVNGWYE